MSNRLAVREAQRNWKKAEWRKQRVKEGLNKDGLHRPELTGKEFYTNIKGEIWRTR